MELTGGFFLASIGDNVVPVLHLTGFCESMLDAITTEEFPCFSDGG